MKTMKFSGFVAALCLVTAHMNSQSNNWCGNTAPDQQWEAVLQDLLSAEKANQGAMKTTSQPIVIPVIIHVVHGGQSPGTYPNLAQGQLVSQIRVLNEDFGGVGYNYNNYPVNAYSNWASTQSISPTSLDAVGRVNIANCNIQFCLATKDTLGNILPEPGIDRINYVTKGWSNPASYSSYTSFKNFIDGTVKPQTIWNVSKYLNIWVTDENLNSIGLLGYATFPYLSGLSGIPNGTWGTSSSDGFWCYARSFGSIATYPAGFYTAGNNRGRICTHEIGHWVGLRHIWGDGTCATDYCNDTPPASSSNYGTPTYPYKLNNCSGNNPNGEMFMNFMDYVDDPSKYMFTPNQADRIQTVMSNSPYRKFLGTHNLCSLNEEAAQSSFKVLVTELCANDSSIALYNTSKGIPAPSYTWSSSGPATFIPDAYSQHAKISFLGSGIYTITLTSNNGTLSTITKTLNVKPLPNINVNVPAMICKGSPKILTATGADTYTWEPGTVDGDSYLISGTSNETLVISGTGLNGCTATDTIFVQVVDCTGLSDLADERSFLAYPNPAKDKIMIRTAEAGTLRAEMWDVAGKVIHREEWGAAEDSGSRSIDVRGLDAGIYFLKLSTQGHTETLRVIKQ